MGIWTCLCIKPKKDFILKIKQGRESNDPEAPGSQSGSTEFNFLLAEDNF
jgi:hypothetical protein